MFVTFFCTRNVRISYRGDAGYFLFSLCFFKKRLNQIFIKRLKETSGKNAPRRKGRVKGYGVTIEELNKVFKSTQRKAFKVLTALAEVTGIDIVLYKSTPGEDGTLRGGVVEGIDLSDAQGAFSWHNNKIYIDVNAGLMNKAEMGDAAKYAMLRTFAHEFTHFIEKHNPVEYENFRELVFDTMRRNGTDPEDLIDAYRAQNGDLSRDLASREVVAEAMTDILPESSFVQELAEKHKNIFTEVYEKLKEFVEDLRKYFASIGSNQAPEVKAVTENLDGAIRYAEDIVKMFDRIAVQAVERYQSAEKAEKNTDLKVGGVRYQLRVFEDGTRFVDVQTDQELFDDLTVSEMNSLAKRIIQEKFVGRVIGLDNRVFVNGASAHEYVFPSKKITPEIREAKLRASTELDNLLDAGMNFRNAADGADGHIHSNVTTGFDYFDTIFKVGSEYYIGVINVMNVQRGKLLKDVTKIRNITKDIISSYGQNPKSNFLRDASTNSIRSSNGIVNNNSSNTHGTQKQRRTSTLTNRDILVNVFESTAKNEAEAKAITEYKEAFSLLRDQEIKLDELNAKIQELSKTTATSNAAKIRQLQEEATKTANRIDTYDRKLRRMEKGALAQVVDREKGRVLENLRQEYGAIPKGENLCFKICNLDVFIRLDCQ